MILKNKVYEKLSVIIKLTFKNDFYEQTLNSHHEAELKIKYLIKPPGWSHDGSSKTSEELRKEFL